MKEYYIYDSELRDLSRTGAFATGLFALGSACIGYWFNIQVGFALAEKVAPEILVQWTVYRNVSAVGAVFCYVVGAALALSGYNRVEKLKAETQHGPEKYEPKPWYRIALFLLVAVGLLIGGLYIGARWL